MVRQSRSGIKNWAKIRFRIVSRDNHKCRMINCVSSLDLNVHHIDYDRSNNDDINLITLCRKCHAQIHAEGYKPCLYEDWPLPWRDEPEEYESC